MRVECNTAGGGKVKVKTTYATYFLSFTPGPIQDLILNVSLSLADRGLQAMSNISVGFKSFTAYCVTSVLPLIGKEIIQTGSTSCFWSPPTIITLAHPTPATLFLHQGSPIHDLCSSYYFHLEYFCSGNAWPTSTPTSVHGSNNTFLVTHTLTTLFKS